MRQADPVGDKRTKYPSHGGQRKRFGMNGLDQSRCAFFQCIQQVANFLRAKQLVALCQKGLIGMSGDNRAGIDSHEPLGNRMIACSRINPECRAIKAGIAGRFACEAVARANIASINGKQLVRPD